MPEHDNNAQAIIDTAIASAKPEELIPGEVFAVVVPEGASVEKIDLDIEGREATPRRKREQVRIFTAASLAQYVAKHDQQDMSAVLFADVNTSRVVAVLNAPTPVAAGWSDHRATLELRHPPSWQRWLSRDGKLSDQVAFAEHLESSLAEIVEPDAAILMELAQTFEAKSAVNFKSAQRLDSGERQFRYEETIDARAGTQGQITIPKEFVVALQPYEGTQLYRVTARLRFRIADGKLAIGYVLDRPDEVLRSAFEDIVAEIEKGTGLGALYGTPPPPA